MTPTELHSNATQGWFIDWQTSVALITSTPMVAKVTPTQPPTVPPTSAPVQAAAPMVYSATVYARGNLNVRDCPQSSCARIGTLQDGQAVQVAAMVDGEGVVVGDNTWYRIQYNGQRGFIYASFTSRNAPVQLPQPTRASGEAGNPTAPPVAPPVEQQPSPRYTCNGIDDLNCGDFASHAEAQAYFLVCGNEDRLDGDGDGLACENN